ncbi:MAG: methylenetetrahydrofolate reductase [Deltaproteobacteria bacterium]|nr:methylenetetrahydrofolate reductase [Deltaproteobacteria bacterium]
MKHNSNLAKRIEAGDFVLTAEFLPRASADNSSAGATISSMSNVTAVNVSDNPYGPVMSSLAGSVILRNAGVEPVYQIITRDRNRIAIQSDLLGAACLGIRNVLCLSGHHQALTGSPDSSNVYDIDSIQLIAAVRQMRDQGILLNGTKIEGDFPMFIGAVANPFMKPMELNVIRLKKKVEAGAEFIQTQAIFDVEGFKEWIEAAQKEGITEKAAIIAGILPFRSAVEAENKRDKYMDMSIPDQVIERMNSAGDEEAQRKEGISICVEVVKEIKGLDGVKGIHILSGGRESSISEVIAEAGL